MSRGQFKGGKKKAGAVKGAWGRQKRIDEREITEVREGREGMGLHREVKTRSRLAPICRRCHAEATWNVLFVIFQQKRINRVLNL